MAIGLGSPENTVRQRLRELCYEATAKRGVPRRELVVANCFATAARLGAELV